MPVVDSYLVCLYGLCLLVFGRLVTTVWTQSAQRFVEKDQRETNIQKHYTQDSMFRGCGCHYVQNRPQALYLTYQMTCLLRSLQHQRCVRIRWRHTADLWGNATNCTSGCTALILCGRVERWAWLASLLFSRHCIIGLALLGHRGLELLARPAKEGIQYTIIKYMIALNMWFINWLKTYHWLPKEICNHMSHSHTSSDKYLHKLAY